jgi:type I restriction enzyme S subunit
MNKYRRYERYKDSGIEWMGEIPEEWEVIPLKRVFKIVNGGTPNSSEENYWNGEIVWITPNDLSKLTEVYIKDSERKITEDGLCNCSAKKVPMNSIIISTRAPIGYVAIAGVDLCTNQGCKSLIPTKVINHKYFYYWIYSISFYLNALGQGTTFMELSNSSLSIVELLTPSMNEQKAIANFLDQKTAEIDDLIADKEKLVELLQEKRQVVISEAVTKGLNPNVRMKDSGIEWIGEIPEHWEVTKLKYITNQIIDGTHSTPQYIDDGIPFLRVTDITNSRGKPINLDEVKYISEEEHKELIKRCNPKKGDLLVSKNGTIGIPKVIDWDYEFSIFVSLCLIKVNKKVDVYYCSYYFESNLIDTQIAFGGKTNTITNLHLDKIKEFIVLLPPVEEQKVITKYINNKAGEIDLLINDIQLQIQKLKEYCQSLISEAVTGKIKVL